jgi:hypothetical protein
VADVRLAEFDEDLRSGRAGELHELELESFDATRSKNLTLVLIVPPKDNLGCQRHREIYRELAG